MRSLIRVLTLAAAGAAAALTASPALASAPAGFPVCIPEAPVCAGITGEPGDYSYAFRFQPQPTGVLTFTVNDAYAPGSVYYESGPTYLRGEYRPTVPLVSGDEVCLSYTISGWPGETCDTVP
ncbi:hypothetical protein [Actinomadura rifamycini]|uniref:hypothetical protein n=1 Tax=Actinomadura rifamycini TaxID=31962 RepID=UPI0004786A50|nr:hypothetical protein [Actinomadura rifamycini]